MRLQVGITSRFAQNCTLTSFRSVLTFRPGLAKGLWDGLPHFTQYRVTAAYRQHWAAGNSASDLSHLADSGRISLWVYGHLHETVDLVRPKGTRIVCNTTGPRFGNAAFRDDLVVKV